MKKLFSIIVVAIACCAMIFTSCKKDEKKVQYVYSLGRDGSISMEHFVTTGKYISENGYEVGANKTTEGASMNDCDNQAKTWFENSVKNIDSDELCGMMSEGEYIKLHVYRSDDGNAVIVEEREYQGTQN